MKRQRRTSTRRLRQIIREELGRARRASIAEDYNSNWRGAADENERARLDRVRAADELLEDEYEIVDRSSRSGGRGSSVTWARRDGAPVGDDVSILMSADGGHPLSGQRKTRVSSDGFEVTVTSQRGRSN